MGGVGDECNVGERERARRICVLSEVVLKKCERKGKLRTPESIYKVGD